MKIKKIEPDYLHSSLRPVQMDQAMVFGDLHHTGSVNVDLLCLLCSSVVVGPGPNTIEQVRPDHRWGGNKPSCQEKSPPPRSPSTENELGCGVSKSQMMDSSALYLSERIFIFLGERARSGCAVSNVNDLLEPGIFVWQLAASYRLHVSTMQ
ncbi:hypothetical protein BC939DRAFT_473060 [Gamsiella multidivaricata]|uniref:uncharacterized protein n=1 Tax=Gamsiella multidivaricata TaxID=101098 RepID=UPI00221F5126|nr:uncharacterized protein BC939DRAFT_473060 [Gamsiella multidivaricata]KAI7831492.1 hypothetical protein BC939DRAFT_473060 [Gamsiella multidivaricata]